jgi:hypothetical protein
MALSDSQPTERAEFTTQTVQASNTIAACNALLAVLDAPEAVRRLFPALLDLLAGRVSVVRFTRREVALRLYAGSRDATGVEGKREIERNESRVTYALSKMQDWIHAEGLAEFIDYQPGKKTIEGDIIPCRIQSPVLKWIAELARKADQTLAEESSAGRRRTWFKAEASAIVKKRLRRSATSTSRIKRLPRHPDAYLAQSIGFLKIAAKHAKTFSSEESVKDRFFSMLRDNLGWVPTENSTLDSSQSSRKFKGKEEILVLENSGREEGKRTQGGGVIEEAFDYPDDIPAEAWAGDEADPDDFQVDAFEDLENLDAVKKGVSDPLPPPCVPLLPDPDYSPILGWASIVAGRAGAHWQALHAALVAGAIPSKLLLGGNGDPGYTGKVDDVQEIYSLGVESDDLHNPRKRQRAMSWPTFLAGGFNGLVERSHREGLSLVVQFKEGTIFHVDDLTREEAELLRPFACLIVETSEGSFQAWVKLPRGEDTDAGRRAFRARLAEMGVKAGNHGSTHSGRWPGSINAKPSRNGWEVSIWSLEPGRRTSLAAIGATMPVRPVAVPAAPSNATRGNSGATRGNPRDRFDWRAVFDDAMVRKNGNRSDAHASLITQAKVAGFSDAEIVAGLLAVSEKASEEMKLADVKRDVERVIRKYRRGGHR